MKLRAPAPTPDTAPARRRRERVTVTRLPEITVRDAAMERAHNDLFDLRDLTERNP